MADRISQQTEEVAQEPTTTNTLITQQAEEVMICLDVPTNVLMPQMVLEVLLCPAAWRVYEA